MTACTSEKLDLSFRARLSPNRQNLDESVRNLVCKPNNSVLEIVVGLDSSVLMMDIVDTQSFLW